MRRRGLLFAACLAVPLAASRAAAPVPVDVALVLVDDVSRSIDDKEFQLQKAGYVSALLDQQVLSAIKAGPNGAIAVNYLEFAGDGEVQTVIDWTVIRDDASAKGFTDKLTAAPRSFWGRTSISAGIDRAVQNLAESGFQATRRVIDVCGDGTNNAGRDVTAARDEAVEAGITINGLAIINEHPVSWTYAHVQPPGGLTQWYRENVAGGPGAFVVEIRDFKTFGEAMTRKLVSEIAAISPPPRL